MRVTAIMSIHEVILHQSVNYKEFKLFSNRIDWKKLTEKTPQRSVIMNPNKTGLGPLCPRAATSTQINTG